MQRKLAIYSGEEQSHKEITDNLNDFFCTKDCLYNSHHLSEGGWFIESEETLLSGKPQSLLNAIEYCMDNNAALFISRNLKGRCYPLCLQAIEQAESLQIYTCLGPLDRKYIKGAIKKNLEFRNRISEGTKKGLAQRQEAGIALGNPHFESIRNRDIRAASKAKKEQAYSDAIEIIDEIDKLPPKEKHSYANIAKVLNQKGVVTRRGKSIHRGTVRRAYLTVANHKPN